MLIFLCNKCFARTTSTHLKNNKKQKNIQPVVNFAGFLQSRGSILANRTRSPRVTVIQLMGNILKQTKCKPVLNECNLYLAKSQSTEKLKISSFLVYLNAFLHMLFTATRTDPVWSNLTHPDFFPVEYV